MSLSHDTLKALHEAATKGEWNVWRQPAPTPVVAKIELSLQVDCTENRIDALVMLEADGKCPAITGCGPTSDDNAALIAYLCSESTRTEILTLIAERDAGLEPRPFSEWSEDYRDVLWHLMPIHEPPFCGTPLDSNWPYAIADEPRLWWTPLPNGNEINKRWEARAAPGGNHHGS